MSWAIEFKEKKTIWRSTFGSAATNHRRKQEFRSLVSLRSHAILTLVYLLDKNIIRELDVAGLSETTRIILFSTS